MVHTAATGGCPGTWGGVTPKLPPIPRRPEAPPRYPAAALHDNDKALLHSWQEEQHSIASQVGVPEYSAAHQAQSSGRYAQLSSYNINGQTAAGNKNYLLIGGVDVSFPEDEANDNAVAVHVILKYVTTTSSSDNDHSNGILLSSPHQPEQCESKPHLTPNVILVDGNGQWHDRYAGLACFVGVKSGIPTVGVGKTFYSLDNEMKKCDVVRDVKQSVQCWYGAHCKHAGLISTKSDDKGCRSSRSSVIVVDNESIRYSTKMEAEQQSTNITAYEDMLIKLHKVCGGLAIPMRSGKNQNDQVLAYALVGHGGNDPTNNGSSSSSNNKKNEHSRGSKNPIYISCGSHISLLDAVYLVACASIVRIPEPIREADLHGRQLLRDQKN
eukprot:scaffold5370_cov160-Skeletonema_marinoi.AAC.4